MNNTGDKTNFFKNPLGVIGLFLVLTEAIASLVIVNSKLVVWQNTILVIFIVLFPCLVLFVFYRLVTKHHKKLYSPGDYKDETHFVSTFNNITQKEEIQPVTIGEEKELYNKDIVMIKDALTSIMDMQKKIIPSIEQSILSGEDINGYVSNMDKYLFEMSDSEETLKVDISPMYESTKLVEELIKNGYAASIYKGFFQNGNQLVSNLEHSAIWLGSEVPVNMAINVLKIARKYYPHLRYIELNDGRDGAPDYVKYQIYIGGATKTAKEHKLKVLGENDFNRLYEVQSQSELHRYIRQFESR